MLIFAPRLGLGDAVDAAVDAFEHLAAIDRLGQHELTARADDADVILFVQCHMVDWRLRAIREHPTARRHWNRVFVFDERDKPWRSFPGVYVSTPSSRFEADSQRAWGYLGTAEPPAAARADILFSFVGSPSAACREPLFALRHPEAVVEKVHDFMFWDLASPAFADRRTRFTEVLARSKFVLCPRGRGTSSFRLYETLAAGRVPVIISDDWVAPVGPNWDAFSLRWPEGTVDGLVALLEERERDWQAMSAAAHEAYASYFAPDVVFHHVGELCRELHEQRPERPSPRRMHVRSLLAALHERLTSG